MIVLMDVGNSCVKWVTLAELHVAFSVTEMQIMTIDTLDKTLARIEQQLPREVQWIHAAHMGGRPVQNQLSQWAKQLNIKLYQAQSEKHRLGVHLPYEPPEQFGVDRFLDLLAAKHRCEREAISGPLAVFDAGTALTLDVIDAAGIYQGGFIVPGLRLSGQSLLSGTAGCHAAGEAQELGLELGHTTAEQIDQGCFAMSLAFIHDQSARLRAEHGAKMSIFLTGGDSTPYTNYLPEIQWVPTLVLEGLQCLSLDMGLA